MAPTALFCWDYPEKSPIKSIPNRLNQNPDAFAKPAGWSLSGTQARSVSKNRTDLLFQVQAYDARTSEHHAVHGFR